MSKRSRDVHTAWFRTVGAESRENTMRQFPDQTAIREIEVAEKLLKINYIKIRDRHRKNLGNIEGLAQSINALGLLQPIGVNGQYVLLFGARRLVACKSLGWTEIPARIIKVDSILAVEFDENEFREAFTISERIQILEDLREHHSITHGGSRKPTSDQDQKIGLEEATQRAGFRNTETYRQAKKAVERGDPALVDALNKRKISISAAALVAALPAEQQVRIASMNKEQMRKELRALRGESIATKKGLASWEDTSRLHRLDATPEPAKRSGSWVTQALAGADLVGVTSVILCHGEKPDVDTLIRLNGDLLACPNGKPPQDPSESLGFHLAHNGRWQHFQKYAGTTVKGLTRELKAPEAKGSEKETPASPDSSEIGANGPDGFAQYPKWIMPTGSLTKDDGDVDISALYGDRNGRIAYVIATYMDGTTNLVEPIYMMKNQNFPFISDKWGPTAFSLIQGDPSIVRLMVFDETGKFVVESTAMNGNIVDTRWVTPPAQSWD